jgi:hypothetical protein
MLTARPETGVSGPACECAELRSRLARLADDYTAAAAELASLADVRADVARREEDVGQRRVMHFRLNPLETGHRALHRAKDTLIARLQARLAREQPGALSEGAAESQEEPLGFGLDSVLGASPPPALAILAETPSEVSADGDVSECCCGAQETAARCTAELAGLEAAAREQGARLHEADAALRAATERAAEEATLVASLTNEVATLREAQTDKNRILLHLKRSLMDRAAEFRNAVALAFGFKVSLVDGAWTLRYAGSGAKDLQIRLWNTETDQQELHPQTHISVNGVDVTDASRDPRLDPLPAPVIGTLPADGDIPMFIARLTHFLRRMDRSQ